MDWVLPIDVVCFVGVALTCFFQFFYLLHSLFIKIEPSSETDAKPGTGRISVIIPVFNCSLTIGRCLKALLDNDLSLVADVVIAMDHCTDASEEIALSFADAFRSKGVEFKWAALPGSGFGKVAALVEGGRAAASRTVLLLDADIILDRRAVREMALFHATQGTVFSSCLIYPHQEPGSSTVASHLVNNNRMYRQGVLQSVKNRFDVANFPGGVQVVDFPSYRALLADGFLEDLVATYQVLGAGGRIAILPKVLAFEVERQSVRGLLLQRIRWTIGAIENLRSSVRTALVRTGLNSKILILSYHVMWELQYYVITAGLAMACLQPRYAAVFLLPWALYVLQILRSVWLGRNHYRNSALGITVHCFAYPLILTAALAGACGLLLKNRCFFFRTEVLFSRD